MTQNVQPRPFDEKAALAELERLADKIQSSRRQRAEAEAQFEAFVRGFREQKLGAAIASYAAEPAARAADSTVPKSAEPPAPRPPQAQPPRRLAAPAPELTRDRATPERRPVPPMSAAASAPAATELPESLENKELIPERSQSARSGRLTLIGLAAVAAAIVLVLIWQPWRNAPAPPATPVPRADTPPPANVSAPSPSPTAPPAAPTPARALNVELTTSRPVWTRVTVDDRRVIERELAANQRIPLAADRTIVIRAGDAGAVRLVVDGKDLGVLGKDGQIGTRTLTAQAK